MPRAEDSHGTHRPAQRDPRAFRDVPCRRGLPRGAHRFHERITAIGGQEQKVELRTQSGRVTVEQQAEGAAPTESGGGASSGLAGAREKLHDARLMHQGGNEDGCLILVEEARAMVPDLAP